MEGERIVSTSREGLPDIQRTRSLHGRTSGPTRRSTKGQWTAEEDEILRQAVERFKGKNWKKIAECFKDRTDVQCLHRWQKVLNPELVKGPWSKEEDEIIIQLVNKYGPKKWSTIARHLPGRIGKQCRERWHNHLNPGINKEAWTQEEELALIRAHQIYGNRWAELTKFLPGRTDNAIKNHWNSSVKKKLDSYMASGLLSQFPALPPVGRQYQFAVSSSSRVQTTEDDTGPYSGVETEEVSECSQGSTAVNCSQSASDAGAAILYRSEGIQFNEEGSFGREQNSDPTCCSEQYFSFKDGDIPVSSVHSAICCSSDLANQRFSCEDEVSARMDYRVNSENLPNNSMLDLRAGSSDLVRHSIGADDSLEGPSTVPNQSSSGLDITSLCSTLGISADQLQQILGSDSEFMLFSEVMEGLSFSTESSREEYKEVRFDGQTDKSLGEASNAQMSEIGKASSLAAQHYDNSSMSDFLGTSCGQLSKAISPSSLKSNNENGMTDLSFDTQQQLVTKEHDSYIYMNDPNDSSCVNGASMGIPDLPEDCSRLIPVNSFSTKLDAAEASGQIEQPVEMEIQDTGSLCYDPPRFPSSDVPFFSCDLVQSDNDTQQEYSPLGIRQLMMMSSVGCISPFRLWDSPSRDNSPDAVLKSAAKTFTNTPSILKKRNRELLSPLSDRRIDKKLGTDIASNLSRDFSRLDVMFGEDDSRKTSVQSPLSNLKKNSGDFSAEKENLLISQARSQEKGTKHALADERHLDQCYDASAFDAKVDEEALNIEGESKLGWDASHKAQPNSLALSEHDINDLLLFSPDQTKNNAENGLKDETPRREPISTASFNHNVTIESSSGNSHPLVCSPAATKTNHKIHKVADLSTLRVPPVIVDNASTDTTNEKLNLFSRTPFKNIQSPSAWKSPCFINPFNYEDIRFFMSPGGFGFDAIEIAKQTHEHSAAAFADAEEVLGIESPQNILKENFLEVQKSDKENHISKEQMGCRLDFNDCETPEKSKETVKTSTARNFSSPSAYLLKGCR